MTVEIYSKPNCSLCDDAKTVILKVRQRVQFAFSEKDISQDAELFERFRYDIPVVFVNGHKAFKYRLTEEQLEARLRR